MKKFIRTILRGTGQVMLQNNALTGLLFLVGIFYNSSILGIGAILGNLISTTTAYLFKYKKEDIENGLYGFNGTLTGIAIYLYFGLNFTSIIAVILGSILSTIIMHQVKKKIPALTVPFVISTWLAILAIKIFDLVPYLSQTIQKANSFDFSSALSMSLGQVMFQGSIVTGIIFVVAILVNSRQAAIYALYGAALGSLIALVFSLPISMINIGLFGYNAVLCGVALESIKWKGFLYATITIILSVILYLIFEKLGIPALTAPFVISAWIGLRLKGKKYFFTKLQTL
ncbi:MAG: urea transporter [Candidatus Paceibacterota bacterium]|jgi:urea transporter